MKAQLVLVGVLVSFATVALIDVRAEKQERANVNGALTNRNVTKLRARIFLETTRNVDGIDEKYDDNEKADNKTPTEGSLVSLPVALATNSNSGGLQATTANVTNTTNAANTTRQKKKAKKGRSEGRFGNIWSMFLPGSGSSSETEDYSDNESPESDVEAGAGGVSSESANSVDRLQNSSTAAVLPAVDNIASIVETVEGAATSSANVGVSDRIGSSAADGPLINSEQHNERLVAKYLRPPRGQESSGFSSSAVATGELLLSSPSGAQQAFAATGADQSATNWPKSTNGSASESPQPSVAPAMPGPDATRTPTPPPASSTDQQPVNLITGALSKDVGSDMMSPNMNDIVSNIMNSISVSPSNNDSMAQMTAIRAASSSGGEREGEDVPVERPSFLARPQQMGAKPNRTINNTNSNASDNSNGNFERWLNRIQGFREPAQPTTPPPINTQATTTRMPPNLPATKPPRVGPVRVDQSVRQSAHGHQVDGTKVIGNLAGNATATSAADRTVPEFNRMVEALAEVRARQLQQQAHTKTLPAASHKPSRQVSNPPPFGIKGAHIHSQRAHQMNVMPQQQQYGIKGGSQDSRHPSRTQSTTTTTTTRYQHPFQQQLRQHQAQLIHGIKYPTAQASTVSISTQEGHSNTSLSFATPLTMNSLMAGDEMSQVVNSTTANSSSGNNGPTSTGDAMDNGAGGGQQVEQSVYQSQDEILRQVTSAINFEQQLSNKKQATTGPMNNDTSLSNHRRPGESVATLESVTNDVDSQSDSLAKLFKVGSSLNELVDLTTTTTSTPLSQSGSSTASPAANLTPAELLKASMGNGSSQSMLGIDDIDRNFDQLAEKLRLLAQQQQQQSPPSTGQPSWLRRPDAVLGQVIDNSNLKQTNLTQLANLLANSSSQSAPGIDHLRDLLIKHDKNRNEMKNSQETMALLMQKLLQSDGKSSPLDGHTQQQQQQRQNSLVINSMANLINSGNKERGQQSGDDGQSGQLAQEKLPVGVSNVGWTPVNAPPPSFGGQSIGPPLISPAKLIKNRGKHPLSALQFSGIGEPGSLKSAGLSNDEQIYMNNLALMFASSQAANHANELNEGIIGLPIAILKEDELDVPAAHLEAEQFAGGSTRQMPRSNLFHQKLASQPMTAEQPSPNQLDQIQKILHAHSPQTFTAAHGVVPRAPPTLGGHQHQQQQQVPTQVAGGQAPIDNQPSFHHHHHHQHQLVQPLNSLASLIPHEHPNRHDQNPFEGSHSHASNENNNIEPTAYLIPGNSRANAYSSNSDHHQHQHQQQLKAQQSTVSQQEPAPVAAGQANEGNQYYAQRAVAQEVRQPPQTTSDHLMVKSAAQDRRPHQQPKQQQQQQEQHNSALGGESGQQPGHDEAFRLHAGLQHAQQRQHQQHLLASRLVYPYTHQFSDYSGGRASRPDELFHHQMSVSPFAAAGFATTAASRSPPSGLVTTTITNGGPPVRLREVSLPAPFGFRNNLAFAYQPSPTVAALAQAASRPPGILRHMTPFRTTFNEGGQRGLLSFMHPSHHQQQQYLPIDHHYQVGRHHNHQSLLGPHPIPPMAHHYDQLRRRSRPESWHSKMGGARSASRARAHHVDPIDNLIGDDEFDKPDNYEQQVKLSDGPVSEDLSDPRTVATLKDEDEELDGLLQIHLTASDGEKPRPYRISQAGSESRQQRGHYDTMRIEQPSLKPCSTPTISGSNSPWTSTTTQPSNSTGMPSSPKQTESTTTPTAATTTTPMSDSVTPMQVTTVRS